MRAVGHGLGAALRNVHLVNAAEQVGDAMACARVSCDCLFRGNVASCAAIPFGHPGNIPLCGAVNMVIHTHAHFSSACLVLEHLVTPPAPP